MTIVEIAALPNGAHNNQTTDAAIPIPEGWAVIPAGMETPNFPFGELTAQEVGGVMTVITWTPLPMPDVPPAPEPEATDTEVLNALLGVTV